MELKRGMKVRLLPLSKVDDSRLSVHPAMERYFGKRVTLDTDPDYEGDFWIVEDTNCWWFSSDWVAEVIGSQGFGVSKQKEQHKDIRLIRMRVK